MEMGTLIFDIDGTICTQEADYSLAQPFYDRIKTINKLYDEGYHICFYTARGFKTGKDWSEITKRQLCEWGVKYHELFFGKPAGDYYIDDKGLNVELWDLTINCEASVVKPWGKEFLLSKTDNYAFKRLEIIKDKCISKQYHNKKEETWHIIEGTGTAVIDGVTYNVKPGDTFNIAPGVIHQIKATSLVLTIIEASTIELEDIVRLDRGWNY